MSFLMGTVSELKQSKVFSIGNCLTGSIFHACVYMFSQTGCYLVPF